MRITQRLATIISAVIIDREGEWADCTGFGAAAVADSLREEITELENLRAAVLADESLSDAQQDRVIGLVWRVREYGE